MQEALLPRESLVISGSCHCELTSLIDVLMTSVVDVIDSNKHDRRSLTILIFTHQWLAMPRGSFGIRFHRILKSLYPILEASNQHDRIYGKFYLRPRNNERNFVYAN